MINKREIINNIDSKIREKFDIKVYKTLTSTNTYLKELASLGAEEWSVVIAKEQTCGKGRMNRKFYSPSDTGVYMSLVLRPQLEAKDVLFVTTMTAAAVAMAIDKIFNVNTGIKWVNDIYLNDKKICGILTESAFCVGESKLDYVIVGIGINVEKPKEDFPEDISDIAGSIINNDILTKNNDFINNSEDISNVLIAEILTNMCRYYDANDKKSYMKVYKSKSILLGKEVYILNDEFREKFKVIDIDDFANLIIQSKNGNVKCLNSGEVSVRLF